MKENWLLTKQVSTEEVLEYLIKEFPQPVGIVLFGTDGDLKTSMYQQCVEKVPRLAIGYGSSHGIAIREVQKPLSENRSVLVTLDEEASKSYPQRNHAVMSLRDFGAKVVLGIYIYPEDDSLPDHLTSGLYQPLAQEIANGVVRGAQPRTNEFDILLWASSGKAGGENG